MSDTGLILVVIVSVVVGLLIGALFRRPGRDVNLVPPDLSAGRPAADPAASGVVAGQGVPAGQRTLADEVVALLRAGRKIQAVKVVRERTDLSLREAKDAVEEIERHGPQASYGLAKMPSRSADRPGKTALPLLPPDVADQARVLAQRGRKIEAIKLVRQHTGLGLREAKEAVERL